MKIWIASMECAGIAEAGGVKNVTLSLCKEFSLLKNKVTLFIPVFKSNCWENLCEINENVFETDVFLCGKKEHVSFSTAICVDGEFDVVLVNHHSFSEKEGVYTYTENEEKMNPECKKGEGHKDLLFKDVLFEKSVCEYSNFVQKSEIPDILHCQDASTAILPAFIQQKKAFKKTQCVVTIHNAGPFYHHEFSSIGEAAWYTELETPLLEKSLNKNRVEPFLLAMNSNANLTTVSEHYAEELIDKNNDQITDGLSSIFSDLQIQIKGITNGFDFARYNPRDKQKSKLPFDFSPETADLNGKLKCRKFFIQNIVNTNNYDTNGIKKFGQLECSSEYTKEIYIAYHGRITNQKGIDILVQAIPSIIENFNNVRFVIAGQGEQFLENKIKELTENYKGKITFMNGYNQTVVRLATAICDFIVLPSFFEPCGLEDFIAQSYGTIPIAHKTGGLNKIIDGKTGFLYENNTVGNLVAKLSEVISLKMIKPSQITKMIKLASLSVQGEFLWKNVIQKKYLPFFKEILKKSKD